MKRLVLTLAGIGLIAACNNGGIGNKKLETLKDKASYAVGQSIGKNIKQQGADLDPEVIAQGLRDGATGAEPKLSDEEIRSTMMAFQEEMMKKAQQKQMASQGDAQKNAEESKAFLEKNAKAEGVKVTASGLQYKVITEGKGKSPKETDQVTVNYRGTLPNGKEFDSSYKRGQPATFPVNGVIRGWTEALQMMKPGAKWMLWIPPELAYGPNGAGADIGPNQALIFEVELLDVKEAK